MLEEFTHAITTMQLTVPALEMFLLIMLLTLALLFRYARTGMVVAYLFTYRWGWGVAEQLSRPAHVGYLLFGVAVGILAVLGMFVESRR